MKNTSLPNVEEAGIIAVGISGHLTAQEQSFFIAGFAECVKYFHVFDNGRYNMCESCHNKKG